MAIQGFCVAFDDTALEGSPTWTRLDTSPYKVTRWSIDRGRGYELDRTGAGTASVTLIDTSGVFDPTNATGTFYGKLNPLKQAALAIWNPMTSAWSTVFRGFVSDWEYVVDPSGRFIGVTVQLVDALDIFAAAELVPDGAWGTTTGTGDVYYPEDLTTDAVQTRIVQVLDEIGWPGTGTSGGTLREIFTGNVKLQRVVYSFGTPALTVIQDAADAEFPAVAQFFIGKDGTATFHGRFARFNPDSVQYHIRTWQAGDAAAVAASPTTVAPVVEPLEFVRDKEHLYTVALALPQFDPSLSIDDADVADQYVSSATAVAQYGVRTWSAENLINAGGDGGTTALEECQKFAQYYVDNYSAPRNRLKQLTFKAASTTGNAATLVWALVCGIDISDRIRLKTTHVGGGGFDDYLFVEGVHYEAVPLKSDHLEITLTIDVSPDYFQVNSFNPRARATAVARPGTASHT